MTAIDEIYAEFEMVSYPMELVTLDRENNCVEVKIDDNGWQFQIGKRLKHIQVKIRVFEDLLRIEPY